MMRTPDGHSSLNSPAFCARRRFGSPHRAGQCAGLSPVMFTVDNIDETLERLLARGARLVGEVVDYARVYRLCYIRGPGGLLIGLAQELNAGNATRRII